MYKIYIHYSDVIYHNPHLTNSFESLIILHILMGELTKSNIKKPLLLQQLGKVIVETSYMMNLVGKDSMIGDGVGALYRFLKFEIT